MVGEDLAIELSSMRAAQAAWAEIPLAERLKRVEHLRHRLARRCRDLAGAIDRPEHESLTSEVLPLLEACRFLEKFASRVLRTKRWGRSGRPLWLSGVGLEVSREPLGVILVIGPSNYPLFLAAVPTLQALTAGNSVIVKPGRGGSQVFEIFCECLLDAGFDPLLVRQMGENPANAQAAIEAGADKVIFTGSVGVGRDVAQSLAKHLTPAVMELSGDDSLFIRDDADIGLAVGAVEFALRFNRGNTCIAPKRVYVARHRAPEFENLAYQRGLQLPVISVTSDEEALQLSAQNPLALGAAVFGGEHGARKLARRIRAGVVVINDVIVPTADPRLPFGGRGLSGYGTTRGCEGLLEMTVAKATAVRAGKARPHYRPVGPGDIELFSSFIRLMHSGSFHDRILSMKNLWRSVKDRRLRE